MKVVIAPDSFKGSISNLLAAQAIGEGWRSLRPTDELVLLPMADGGEGTLETIASQFPQAIRIPAHLKHEAWWLLLPDGTAYVELASICGLTLQQALDPLGASTFDLGVVLKEIAGDLRTTKIVISVGGSASTDGGAGLLLALGAKLNDINGDSIDQGGAGLLNLVEIDLREIISPPGEGVLCLTDVNNPLIGELGAAEIYSPQKGATPEQVSILAEGLKNFLEVSGANDFPGAGAAGGTPFGLKLAWGCDLESGALAVAKMIGLEKQISDADLVITGEGRLDAQSEYGKVVGVVSHLAKAHEKPLYYCVGSSDYELGLRGIALVDIAPSVEDAISEPYNWLRQAGFELALLVTD